MREVEVKYRVRDLEALLAALKMRGIELGVPFCQDDQAYAPDELGVWRRQARGALCPPAYR